MKKVPINSNRFPFHLGDVRVTYPGTLNGKQLVHDPRGEYDGVMWINEEES